MQHTSHLVDLQNLKMEWIRQGDTCLFRLKTMKDQLVRILRKVGMWRWLWAVKNLLSGNQQTQVKEHICNTHLISEHRDKLHDLDINNIAVLIVEHATSPEHSRVFFAMTDEQAQYMVDTLQNVSVRLSQNLISFDTGCSYSCFTPNVSKNIKILATCYYQTCQEIWKIPTELAT